MILLSEEGIENIDRAFSTVAKWRKRNVATPLFLTKKYVSTSLDVYPIEYLNFQRNHILVYGMDILKDLEFNPDYVRLQCEREIKGKLLLLREAFIETSGKKFTLRELIIEPLEEPCNALPAALGELGNLRIRVGACHGLVRQPFHRIAKCLGHGPQTQLLDLGVPHQD